MARKAPLNQLGERVRAGVANLQGMLAPHEDMFPDTAAAVASLAAVVGVEFAKVAKGKPRVKARGLRVGKNRARGLRRGKKPTLTLANAPWRVRALRPQLRYSRTLRDSLKQRLGDLTCGKLRRNNALTPHPRRGNRRRRR